MHEERISEREERMWSQIYNEAGSNGEKRQRPERIKDRCGNKKT